MYCYRKKKEKDRDRKKEDKNDQYEQKEEEMKFNLDALRDLFQKAKVLVIPVLHNKA